MMNNLNNKMKL